MKNEIIENYITMTINEIKDEIRWYVNLDKEKEKITDEKMHKILLDLVNNRFNNLNKDKDLNLIYTFLPLNDKNENEKIKRLFTLYYTASYYDNVDLLAKILKSNVKLYNYNFIHPELLDKDLSSRFNNEEYVKIVKEKDLILLGFIHSISKLDDKEKSKYIDRFINLLNLRYNDLENSGFYISVLSKKTLDTFTNEAYLNANKKQLFFIANVGDSIDEDNKNRLNKLIINSDYSNNLCNMNLMLKLFTDEELYKLSYSDSEIISYYSDNEEMLNKAIDLVRKYNDVESYRCIISKDLFMKISNDVLYEMSNNFILSEMDDSPILVTAKLYTPKAKVKRIIKRKK